MGADLKRKEARKRKFEGQNRMSGPNIGIQLNEGASPDHPPQKISRHTLESPIFSKSIETAKKVTAGRLTVADGFTDRGEEESPSPATQKAQRFIVFIGNLPYTATDESISRHFLEINPISIRHQKEKGTGKSKGFAFLEFEDNDRMKKCLNMYHQSTFEDGKSPARKLNVELTAGGGGGKSKDRRSKLRTKNLRLSEQRKRREQGHEEQGEQFSGDCQPLHVAGNNCNIHPSRRSRVTTTQNNIDA